MTLTSDEWTIIILAGIVAIVFVAVLAPASLSVLIKAIEGLIGRVTNTQDKP